MSSLPVRGAWIEIDLIAYRLPRTSRRSPCGERGLKSLYASIAGVSSVSLPVRGAWIEICLLTVCR